AVHEERDRTRSGGRVADAARRCFDAVRHGWGLLAAHASNLRRCGGFIQRRPRFLLEYFRCADIWDWAVADARDAEFGEPSVRWHALHDHDVHGQRDAIADASDQCIVHQAGNEVAGRAGGCIGFGPIESLSDSLRWVIAMFKEHVGPRVDEDLDALMLGCLADSGNPARLPGDIVETHALDDPVLEIDTNHARVEKARDVAG